MSASSRIAYLRKPAHAGQQWFGRGVHALMPTERHARLADEVHS